MRLTPPPVLGCLLVTSGALLRLLCYRALGQYFTFEAGITRNHRLVTTGPYARVRHPAYAGAVLAYLGLLLHYGPGSWVTECVCKGSTAGAVFCAGCVLATSLVVAGLLSRIAKEDRALRREFGREWDEWAARVPCVLIPCVY
jgi:protein-S-isoprenylcysteine O-methyltransferase Ste14